MRIPKSIRRTDLPNDCGLVAAAAYSYLKRHEIACRLLYINYGPNDGHMIVVYKVACRLRTFDNDGSMTFSPDANWKSPPILLAKAWAVVNGVKKKVRDAKWY